MLEDFFTYIESERRFSPLTVSNYRRDIERFVRWLGVPVEQFDPRTLTADSIHDWIVRRSGADGLSAASVNRELASLRSLWRYLRSRGEVDSDIFLRIGSLKVSRKLPSFVPETRMERVLDDAAQASSDEDFERRRNALILLMLYGCGLRLAELVAVDRDHFSGDMRSLRVRGKGDKERVIPIVEALRGEIISYIEFVDGQNICKSREKALFLTSKGARISRSAVYRAVRAELTKAGVQGKKSPHVLRHTFATHLLNDGADMREIQELMGHASLSSTQVYTHNSIGRLKEAYARAHPRSGRRSGRE
ncbi:MAG: tyrosine-type recombinase/integrase [Alistipes sp.]|nr:tyrosine-type recombinase/integrase [Alistipes sp.]MDE6779078.1 tyrosine-type recombinase/integrase [Alistipes sp.]